MRFRYQQKRYSPYSIKLSVYVAENSNGNISRFLTSKRSAVIDRADIIAVVCNLYHLYKKKISKIKNIHYLFLLNTVFIVLKINMHI